MASAAAIPEPYAAAIEMICSGVGRMDIANPLDDKCAVAVELIRNGIERMAIAKEQVVILTGEDLFSVLFHEEPDIGGNSRSDLEDHLECDRAAFDVVYEFQKAAERWPDVPSEILTRYFADYIFEVMYDPVKPDDFTQKHLFTELCETLEEVVCEWLLGDDDEDEVADAMELRAMLAAEAAAAEAATAAAADDDDVPMDCDDSAPYDEDEEMQDEYEQELETWPMMFREACSQLEKILARKSKFWSRALVMSQLRVQFPHLGQILPDNLTGDMLFEYVNVACAAKQDPSVWEETFHVISTIIDAVERIVMTVPPSTGLAKLPDLIDQAEALETAGKGEAANEIIEDMARGDLALEDLRGFWNEHTLGDDFEELDVSLQDFIQRMPALEGAVRTDITGLSEEQKINVAEHTAMHAMRMEQQCTDAIFDPTNFELLCREIGEGLKADLAWEPEAVEALREASCDYMVQWLSDANKFAMMRPGAVVEAKDLQKAKAVRNSGPTVEYSGYFKF